MALAALVTWFALCGAGAAQTANPAALLQLPDLTVTTEDPLILLPPLGPPVSRAPIAAPHEGAPRARLVGAPLATDPGIGVVPRPIRVLRAVQAAEAGEHTTRILVRAGVVDPASPSHLPASLRMAYGNAERTASLHVSGSMPIDRRSAPGQPREPGELAARGMVGSRAWQLGLDGSLAAAGRGRAWHAGVTGASGPVHLTFSYHRWLADPAAPGWQIAGAAALVWNLPVAPVVRLGLVAGWSELGTFAFPEMRLHYVPAPEWRLAAGVRPVVGFPRRVADLIADDPDRGAGLHPDRALIMWLGGGHGAVDVRVGLAHGLHRGPDAARRAARESGTDSMLFGMTAGTAPAGAGSGEAEMTLHAGGNWHRREASWSTRVLATAEWHPAVTLPVAALVRARWIQSSGYTAIDTDEDWSLGIFREDPGLAVVVGLRWSVAYGHDFAIVGGVHRPDAAADDLTWGLGIAYAQNVVRLLAPTIGERP